MKLLTICMPALMLGAAAFVTPALAQADANAAASGNAATAAPAQPAQDANSAAVPAQSQTADSAAAPSQTAMSSQSSGATSSGNTQMAMNSTGNASDLSSIPDNQHKYSRAKKASEDRSEDQTTKQLNQQEASVSGASTASAQ
jgi:hypothetical protein